MRRLRLLIAGRRADGERGAILVLTAFLVSFVAIGLLALTVDLGNITYNRAELQNGSDAAALSLAAACAQPSATTSCGVSSSLTNLAVQNANVSDQSMSILTDSKTCIGGAAYTGTTSLPQCSDPTAANPANVSSCQPWPLATSPNKVSYVEVTTQTKMKNGSSILPFHFAQVLSGTSSGTTQRTCSRAAWGAAGSTGSTLPITMGSCDWARATNNGQNYATMPPYSVPAGSGASPPPEVQQPINTITAIFAHATTANLCSSQPNGGFSWLQPDNASNCSVTIGVGDTAPSSPGSSIPCANVLSTYLGKVVTIPVFDSSSLSGNNATYHIAGVAAFYLAGYDNVPSAQPRKTMSVYMEPSSVCTGSCNGSTTYVWGWFVSSLLPVGSGTISTAPNMGANIIVAAG